MVIYRPTTPPSAGAANGHANGGGGGTAGRPPRPDLNAQGVSEMNMRGASERWDEEDGAAVGEAVGDAPPCEDDDDAERRLRAFHEANQSFLRGVQAQQQEALEFESEGAEDANGGGGWPAGADRGALLSPAGPAVWPFEEEEEDGLNPLEEEEDEEEEEDVPARYTAGPTAAASATEPREGHFEPGALEPAVRANGTGGPAIDHDDCPPGSDSLDSLRERVRSLAHELSVTRTTLRHDADRHESEVRSLESELAGQADRHKDVVAGLRARLVESELERTRLSERLAEAVAGESRRHEAMKARWDEMIERAAEDGRWVEEQAGQWKESAGRASGRCEGARERGRLTDGSSSHSGRRGSDSSGRNRGSEHSGGSGQSRRMVQRALWGSAYEPDGPQGLGSGSDSSEDSEERRIFGDSR